MAVGYRNHRAWLARRRGAAGSEGVAREGTVWDLDRSHVLLRGALLVTHVDGVRLDDDHGFPARLLIPGLQGQSNSCTLGRTWSRALACDRVVAAARSGGVAAVIRALVVLQLAVVAACVLALIAAWLIGALGLGVYGSAWR